jgi:CRP-like cAMP-binding protein
LHIFQKNPQLSHIPFIFLTAKTDRADLRKGMEMGADDYIPKPFTELELLNAIENRWRKQTQQQQEKASNFSQFWQEVKANREMQHLSKDRKPHLYKKKQIIYIQEGEPNKLFFLQKGKVKLYQLHPDGKEFITQICVEGEFFGYHTLFENKPYNETAETLEESQIIHVPKNEFSELIFKNQNVAYQFIKMLANSVTEKENFLLNMAYNSLRKRVAEVLYSLAPKFQKEEQKNITITISREDLASIVGTATESLIRTLSDFKQEKLIEIVKGKIIITDMEKLKKLKF